MVSKYINLNHLRNPTWLPILGKLNGRFSQVGENLHQWSNQAFKDPVAFGVFLSSIQCNPARMFFSGNSKIKLWGGSLQKRHNDRNGVSNYRRIDCLLNYLFRHRSKKTSKLRVTGLHGEYSPVTTEFRAQRASYADNVSIWWSHHMVCICRQDYQSPNCIDINARQIPLKKPSLSQSLKLIGNSLPKNNIDIKL